MALRHEDLAPAEEAVVYRFPEHLARRRARAARRLARLRRTALWATAVLFGASVLLGGGVGNGAPASRAGAPRAIVMRPGQTLWDVAERYGPDGVDPRAYVDSLESLNHLDGTVQAGTRIGLPR
jgi:hypothetical protein